jgi:hypothetical protein
MYEQKQGPSEDGPCLLQNPAQIASYDPDNCNCDDSRV